jgi:hypothetical protein
MKEDISKEVIHFAEVTSVFDEWINCRQSFLRILADGKPWIHALPVLSCLAVGGSLKDALPLAVAWLSLLHAADLVDDAQDGKYILAKKYVHPDHPTTIALSWIFAAFRLLNDSSITKSAKNRITSIFSQAGFESAFGQYLCQSPLDFPQTDRTEIKTYWHAVILKSGSIGMAGTASGAALVTTSQPLIDALGDYGTALGVIKQVIDDCRDTFEDASVPIIKHRLPALLHSLISRKVSANVKSGESFVEAMIPEIITDILLEWQRRGQVSLQKLEPSKARDELYDILELALNPNLSTV